MGRRDRSKRGLTLAEVAVASAVMIFVTFASTTLLVAGLASQSSQLNQSDLQRDAAGVLSRLSDELSESDPASFRIDSAPQGVVFASPRDALGRFSYATDGSLMWGGYICYYVDTVNGTPSVVRTWSPLGTPVSGAPAVPVGMTTAWFQLRPLARRTVGTHVSSFTITGSNPLLISLTVSLQGRHSLSASTRVFLRN